jgi:hypothetical protein
MLSLFERLPQPAARSATAATNAGSQETSRAHGQSVAANSFESEASSTPNRPEAARQWRRAPSTPLCSFCLHLPISDVLNNGLSLRSFKEAAMDIGAPETEQEIEIAPLEEPVPVPAPAESPAQEPVPA